ncbi:MAG: FHA domain-containing protein [Lachnospiraceae bacterium]
MDMNRWRPINEVYIPPIPQKGTRENVVVRPRRELVRESAGDAQTFAFTPTIDDEQTVPLTPPIDDEATTLLTEKQEVIMAAYLVRLKSNERILIGKDEFTIGKGIGSADYVIADNTAVSRQHAKISCRDGEYFLTDLNSLNHTYIDDQQLSGDRKLINQTNFRVADEQFTFMLERADEAGEIK